MAARSRILSCIFLLSLLVNSSDAGAIPPSLRSWFPRAISDLKEAVLEGLGTQENGVELSGFDPGDAKVGQSMAYEFHIEIDKRIIPIKLLEDVSRWEFVDFASIPTTSETALAETKNNFQDPRVLPVLPPFQLAGPMELWIQDGDDVRLALPHEVEAGVLKKVVLSDGAKVTVTGAKSVALRHAIELPLPLNRTRGAASGLLAMAAALRHAARSKEKPFLSLKIVGPTSLSSSSTSAAPTERLKLKRLAPGLVELSSTAVPALPEDPTAINAPFLWPLSSLNGSDSHLRGFEALLWSVLGKRGAETGSFRLLKSEVSATTYLKLGFSVTRPVSAMDVDWSSFPSWKTKPERIRTRFEVLARVADDGNIVPERIAEIPPVPVIGPPPVPGNVSMSRQPIYHPPPDYFAI
ncbi:tunicamycin induced protein [Wolffia australiana]